MNQIFIDGTDFTDDVLDGLDDISITWDNNSTGSLIASVSSPITFGEAAYDYLKSKFWVDKEAGLNATCQVLLYIDCCNLQIPFTINAKSVRDCVGCSAVVNLVEVDENSRCYDYLNTKLMVENVAGDVQWCKMRYCEGTDFADIMIGLVLVVIAPLLIILDIIERIIKTLCDVVDFLVFWKDLNCESIRKWFPSIGCVASLIGDCNRYHSVAFVWELIEENAKKCGLAFESSILKNTPYDQLVLFSPLNVKGCLYNAPNLDNCPDWGIFTDGVCGDTPYQKDNFYDVTTIQFLEQLKNTFPCTDYQIIDGTLYFESEKFFESLATVELFNVEEAAADGCFETLPCYAFFTERSCAYGRFEYSRDFLDRRGNEAFAQHYSDIVEYNQPPNDWQKGECPLRSPFGPARFQFDRWQNSGQEGFRFLFGHGDSLVLQSHTVSSPKLLVLEPEHNCEDAKVISRPAEDEQGNKIARIIRVPGLSLGGALTLPIYAKDYNYPMYYDAEYPIPELIQTFGECMNPRSSLNDKCVLDSLQIAMDCEMVQKIVDNDGRVRVGTAYGWGYPDSITTNFGDSTITLTNVKI